MQREEIGHGGMRAARHTHVDGRVRVLDSPQFSCGSVKASKRQSVRASERQSVRASERQNEPKVLGSPHCRG
eukprot:scaffold1462_cov260-Pinguiococcus_pyrenoidosus.AAC.11